MYLQTRITELQQHNRNPKRESDQTLYPITLDSLIYGQSYYEIGGL
jgi:hypothetical protein